MHECGRLERVICSLALQVARGDAAVSVPQGKGFVKSGDASVRVKSLSHSHSHSH
jgi:hypothetical protein